MKNSVKLTVDISPSVDESEVIIRAKEETALVSKIVSLVQQYNRQDRTPITVYQSSNRNMVSSLISSGSTRRKENWLFGPGMERITLSLPCANLRKPWMRNGLSA